MDRFNRFGRIASNNVGSLLAILSLTLFSGQALAAGSSFFPAQFSTGDRSVVAELSCPANPEEGDSTEVVFCQASVQKDGTSDDGKTFCFENGDTANSYAAAATAASRNAVFQPALVDDQPVEVLFNYRVFFSLKSGGCQVGAVPNSGFQAAELGMTYYSPQEIVSEQPSWVTRAGVFKQGGSRVVSIDGKGMMYLIAVDVDESGETDDGDIVKNNFATRQEARRALNAMKRSNYIPGFHKGVAAPMKYFGYVYVNSENDGAGGGGGVRGGI